LGFDVDRNRHREILFVWHVSSLLGPAFHARLVLLPELLDGQETSPSRFLPRRSSAQAFTVSKASAALVNQRRAKALSISRKNASHSRWSANSIDRKSTRLNSS